MVAGDLLDGLCADGLLIQSLNSGGDARDFRGIWRSAAEITLGRFEAVEIGG